MAPARPPRPRRPPARPPARHRRLRGVGDRVDGRAGRRAARPRRFRRGAARRRRASWPSTGPPRPTGPCGAPALRPGSVKELPVGLVHDVVATTAANTTSIHVYSPPLTTMRRWDSVTLEPGAVEAGRRPSPPVAVPSPPVASHERGGRPTAGGRPVRSSATGRGRPSSTTWSPPAPWSSTSGRSRLRNRDGDLPGAVVVDRNQLEWRLDPTPRAPPARASTTPTRWSSWCATRATPAAWPPPTLRQLG